MNGAMPPLWLSASLSCCWCSDCCRDDSAATGGGLLSRHAAFAPAASLRSIVFITESANAAASRSSGPDDKRSWLSENKQTDANA